MQDSALISTMLTSDYIHMLKEEIFINYFCISKDDFNDRLKLVSNNSAIHIIIDSSIEKDGPSAGGAFMIAHLSKLLGHTLSKHVAITGEINSNFKITAIGGLNMKINGSIIAGCRSIIIPTDNIVDVIKEIVNENSIDVKNEYGKRLCFIYYSDIDKCFNLLVRTKPYNTLKDNLSSFDVNVEEGNSDYLIDFDLEVPSIYKIKLDNCSKYIINHVDGLNIKLINDVSLRDVMKNHIVVLAMENIYEIYYYMVMAKHVYSTDEHNIIIDKITDITFDGNKIEEK
jgi:hypothetical protein